jgi:hypothetical protein
MTDEPNPTEALQQQLDQANQRLVQAELKNHAIRAGIIDVDCLKMLDSSALKLDEHGNLPDAAAALARLKKEKPWVFRQQNSSHPVPPPAPEAPQQKNAKEMTQNEWRLAREQLIKRS